MTTHLVIGEDDVSHLIWMPIFGGKSLIKHLHLKIKLAIFYFL